MGFPLLNSLLLLGNASPIQSCKRFIKSKRFTLSKKECRKDLVSISFSSSSRNFWLRASVYSSRRSPFGTRWMDKTNLSQSLSQTTGSFAPYFKVEDDLLQLGTQEPNTKKKLLFFPKKKMIKVKEDDRRLMSKASRQKIKKRRFDG